jgi:putative transposase
MRQNYWQTLYSECYYHIYNRTNNHELLFLDYPDRKHFLKQWQHYLGDYVDTYAYCLMSNHFHFIVKIKTVGDNVLKCAEKEKTQAAQKFVNQTIDFDTFLEDQFKRFFSSYALSLNEKYKRNGSLFQKKFKRVELTTLLAIVNKICYVHHNPLHHGSSTYYDGWEYSSYKAYLSTNPTKICREEGLKLFDDAKSIDFFKSYHQSFHENWIDNQKWKDFEEGNDM